MYNYENEKAEIFTEQGQRMFLTIRDTASALIKKAGAARMQEIISGCCGSSWTMLACVDRLVELGEIREIKQDMVAGQHRIFVGV